MRILSFEKVIYEGQDRQVSWRGTELDDGQEFNEFMTKDVAARFYDQAGEADFQQHILGLAGTDIEHKDIEAILTADVTKEPWAVGESLAEAYLKRTQLIIWPWNKLRDKPTPNASLPGPDLVGFDCSKLLSDDKVRLVIGEVKTSSENKSPPGVMQGQSGMMHQIDNRANDRSLIWDTIRLLFYRCKDAKNKRLFSMAVQHFLSCEYIAFFGILIRDTPPNKMDLQAAGHTLAGKLNGLKTCSLKAIYLPMKISELTTRVSGGEL